MKKACILTVVFYLILTYSFALTTNEIERAASSFLREHNRDFSIKSVKHLQIKGKMKTNVVKLEPTGFILMSDSREDVPVLGYSFSSNLEICEKYSHTFSKFISKLMLLNSISYSDADNILEWDLLLSGQTIDRPVEYWPPDGTTVSGGWIETSWEQYAPYNMFCPNDPTDQSSKSLAGCPSVAMGMIVDYHKQTNNTTFSQSDSYITPYNYSIGVDYVAWDFLSFSDINSYIGQIQNCYDNNIALNDTLKAALIFACGVSAKQQAYTVSGSGTYFTPQIENGYKRFGFTDAVTLLDSDIDLSERMKQNMKLGMPAQMCALIASGGGHQIIVDGYNTNEEFHFNFGWGGMADGWYSFPLSGMPSGLNIFSSVVLDINKDSSNYADFSITSPIPSSVYGDNECILVAANLEDAQSVSEICYYIDGEQWYTGSTPINFTYNTLTMGNGFHTITVAVTNNDSICNYKSVNVIVSKDSLIYNENFDNGLNGWICQNNLWENDSNSLQDFSVIDEMNVFSPTVHADFQNQSTEIISPQIQIPYMDELNVEFYTAYAHQYPQSPSLRLKARFVGTQNWITLWVSTDETGMFCWTKQTADITALTSSNVEFAFECAGIGFGDVSIDDFRIYGRNNTDIDHSSASSYTGVSLINYPNPFNPETTISFNLPERQQVKLSVYNIKGQKVAVLIDCFCEKGDNSIVWKGRDSEGLSVGSGVYFTMLEYGGDVKVNKMILIK